VLSLLHIPVRVLPSRISLTFGSATSTPALVIADELIGCAENFCHVEPESIERSKLPDEPSIAEILVPSLDIERSFQLIPAKRVISCHVLPEFVEMSMCP
jgi:hypothetical protein